MESEWIVLFWEDGWNILEYFYITLQYTEEFFTEDDVLNAINIAEQELGLKDNQLHKDWNELKNGGIQIC